MLPLVVVKLHNYTQILPKRGDLTIAFQTYLDTLGQNSLAS